MKRLFMLLAALVAAGAAAAVFLRRNDEEAFSSDVDPGRPEPAAPTASPPAGGVEGYCVRERKKVQLKDPKPTKTKGGRDAIRGTCPDCGAEIFRFGKA